MSTKLPPSIKQERRLARKAHQKTTSRIRKEYYTRNLMDSFCTPPGEIFVVHETEEYVDFDFD